MTLRIITDRQDPCMGEFARSVQFISSKIRFNGIVKPDPVRNNKRLLRDAQMAQGSMSELMAIRRQVAELCAQFAALDIHNSAFEAAVAAIRKTIAHPPMQKVVSLFNSEDSALFQKAWLELGMLDLASSSADKALHILDGLDAKIVCMLRHHEKVLLDTVIARENIAALADTANRERSIVIGARA